jgi:hypothetical protein
VGDVLSERTLNRTLLARQRLLERVPIAVEEVLSALVGLQAQEPRDPYVALWSRVDGFEPSTLERLLVDRRAVRIVLMRGTVHLVTADECCAIRQLFQPILDYELTVHSEHKEALATFDIAPLLGPVGELLAEAPRTPSELRALIAARFPDAPAAAARAGAAERAVVVDRAGALDDRRRVARAEDRSGAVDRRPRAQVPGGLRALDSGGRHRVVRPQGRTRGRRPPPPATSDLP